MMRLLPALFLMMSMMLALPMNAKAQLQIDITKSEIDPIRIAVPEFISGGAGADEFTLTIADVISSDLERSGLFTPMNRQAFIETQTDIQYEPTFSSWRTINAQVLVSGRVVEQDSNTVIVEYRLWDVIAGRQLDSARLRTPKENWRRIAHKIADRIYTSMTGESGYFDSRIVFIDESGPKTERRKRLAIIDQDGANPVYLVGGSDLTLTPRFHPSEQRIAFLSYETGRPEVYLMDIATGARESLGSFRNMTSAPKFSPDGRSLVLTQMARGNSDIYSFDLASRRSTALTTAPGIDTSPDFSPDGRQIVFNSDRGGSPQIYVMNSDGSSPKRISFGDGRHTAPAWSPRGDKIAFVRQNSGKFYIGVMNPDGSGMRMLTDGWLLDNPTWSPNGRVILFTKEARGATGRSEIWSIDLTGRNLRRVNTPRGASDPAWGPLLP